MMPKVGGPPKTTLLFPQRLMVLGFKIFMSEFANPHCHNMSDDWFYSAWSFFSGLVSSTILESRAAFLEPWAWDWNYFNGGTIPLECQKQNKTKQNSIPLSVESFSQTPVRKCQSSVLPGWRARWAWALAIFYEPLTCVSYRLKHRGKVPHGLYSLCCLEINFEWSNSDGDKIKTSRWR